MALIAAEARRVSILSARYPTELILSIAVLVTIFSGIVAGATAIGRSVPETLTVMGAAYLVWLAAAGPLVGIAADVQAEVRGGTLENLCMSRHPLATVLLARACASCVHALLVLAVLGLAMVAAGAALSLSWALWVYAACLMVAAAGVGMALAGLALAWKRVQFLLVATHAMLVPLVFAGGSAPAAPTERLIEAAVPLSTAARCAKAALAGAGCGNGGDLIAAVANAAVCFAVGLLAFQLLYARAEAAGSLAER
jgi:hypothetical protein